jgi:hypothetical protein
MDERGNESSYRLHTDGRKEGKKARIGIKAASSLSELVIDRKRNFLFRPKTNIRQEYAAEYSDDNEYSAQ